MKIFLTGASGYIGSAVGRRLMEEEHVVAGLARSEETATTLAAEGMEVVRGDLSDPASLQSPCRAADAVIHAASTGDENAGRLDERAVDGILEALTGTAKPFVYTSGVWVLGDTGHVRADEDFRSDPPELVAWRLEVEETVRDASTRDIRTTVVRPGVVYGGGGGILSGMIRSATDDGEVRVVGDGRQIWSMVHLDDLADLYVRLLGADKGSVYNAAGAEYPARDLALAACIAAAGEARVVEWDRDEARAAMGPFADAAGLSQRVSSARAAEELGWIAKGPTPLEELVRGSYAA